MGVTGFPMITLMLYKSVSALNQQCISFTNLNEMKVVSSKLTVLMLISKGTRRADFSVVLNVP